MKKTGRARCKTSSYSHDEIGKNKQSIYFTATAAIPAQLCPLLSTIRRENSVLPSRQAGKAEKARSIFPVTRLLLSSGSGKPFPIVAYRIRMVNDACAVSRIHITAYWPVQNKPCPRKRPHEGERWQNKCPHGLRTCGHCLFNEQPRVNGLSTAC